MTQHTMLFQNPVFEDNGALKVTVRYGLKWAHALELGDTIRAVGLDNEERGVFTVAGVLVTSLVEIPEGVVALVHDPAARTVESLNKVLSDIYPEIGVYDEITAVFLHPYKGDARAPALRGRERFTP